MIICILQIWTKRIVKKSFCVFSLILRLDNSCEVCHACTQNIKIFKHSPPQPSYERAYEFYEGCKVLTAAPTLAAIDRHGSAFQSRLKCKAFFIKLIVGSGRSNPEPFYINTAVGSGWRTSHDAQSSSPPHSAFICHCCMLPASLS